MSNKNTDVAALLQGISGDAVNSIGAIMGVPQAEAAAMVAQANAQSDASKDNASITNTKTLVTGGVMAVGLLAAALIGITLFRR